MSPRKKDTVKSSEKSLELPVFSTSGKELEKISLDEYVFDGKINHATMHQAVVIYLANQRKGLANTKTRGEVSGGGRKPWKQKGTGRARAGSTRSPLWRGGGITFGPKPHSFTKDFPQKMKAVALKSALNSKLIDNELVIVDSFSVTSPKTKEVVSIARNLKIDNQKSLFVVSALDKNLKLAARNIDNLFIQEAKNLNTYDTLSFKKVLFVKSAILEVQDRIKKVLK
jgi:large subunit ribosomal protein L4